MHVQVADPLNARAAQAIYAADESSTLRMSHENPEVLKIYAEFLGEPLGKVSHHLLHTEYGARQRV